MVISGNNPQLLSKKIVHSNIKQQDKNLFYKCIHLKKEIAIFIYFDQQNNFYIKLNELKIASNTYSLNTIQDININKYEINSYFENADIIKMNDNRFIFVSTSPDNLTYYY